MAEYSSQARLSRGGIAAADTRNGHGSQRSVDRPLRRSVDGHEAYLFALRVAYLAYLLQPRQKRTKVIQRPVLSRASTSNTFSDVIKDFQVVRDAKTSKYPHAFVRALEKRLEGILKLEERLPEYHDKLIRRTFGSFLNTLREPSFRKQAEENKRAEDLVLMFYSRASKELSTFTGKTAHDDGVARLTDRHVALFVRLMCLILREKGWAEERRDLTLRLVDLEKKLLKHEEDLAGPSTNSSAEGGEMTIQEEVPLTHKVEEMPLVQVVGQIFQIPVSALQSDISSHRSQWTEAEALKDLKTYQTHLAVGGTRRTLSEVDFDTREAFEEWKRAEIPEVTQMIVSITTVSPQTANLAGSATAPQLNPQRASLLTDNTYSELSKALTPAMSLTDAFTMPDLNGLQLDDNAIKDEDEANVYTFIPFRVRDIFRYVMNLAMLHDLGTATRHPDSSEAVVRPLSKQSIDLLHELAVRWRIPRITRVVVFLDCVREMFQQKHLNLEQLDEALNFAKSPVQDDAKQKRAALVLAPLNAERHKWPRKDFGQLQQILHAIHASLLDMLEEAMMSCYDNKQSPLLGMVLAVIDIHLKSDPIFASYERSSNARTQEMEIFQTRTSAGLAERARDVYNQLLDKEIPSEQSKWEFFHIIQLGREILTKLQKTQKRFRGANAEIVGIEPLKILIANMLPSFAEDSKAMIESVVATTKAQGEEVPIQDGFELYKSLAEFRDIYTDALPGQQFPYKIEDLLQDFVWKWIEATDSQIIGWVEQAIRTDDFQVRTENKNIAPTQEQRHSNSVLDVFKSFQQVVDQVNQLRWQDDLTYAKFMTSLAKSVGAGITRYCEILDVLFSKEMDRLTPEQEAVVNQTNKEKLMKYAKDTWTQDTKVEPFHFYAESFVKLNDISLAIHQWDMLEKDMRVDQCAEVIKKHNPVSVMQQRKITKYVFTIKIVEAEGLKAMDVNGFSDPYVVLTDEYQKRLFKTKTIYRNLNPRWEESIDISTQTPLNLIATVWDWDALGDHDYVGRTSLKLDPSHFSDFLPREYWQPLDTQGRLLVKVNMDGERDDIQFYFAKAFRALQRTQRDMTRKITDKLSAYINHCLSRRTLKSLTSKGLSVASVSSFINSYRNRAPVQQLPTGPTESEIDQALQPLFNYFNANFFIMNQTLTSDAMVAVMTRLWKEVLVTIELLLVPPLSDLPSTQKPLLQAELDIVFKWLRSLLDFFNAVDSDTGQANGVPLNVLKSSKYHEVQTLNFFYFETTENLVRTSERIAAAAANTQAAQRSRLSAPPSLSSGGGGGHTFLPPPSSARRAKSIMMARNLGTMRRAKEEKWKAAQAEPSDDMILRILRMRPEAGEYLKDRSRQKERLAAAAAAKAIVEQSLLGTGGRMTGPSVIRR